MGVNNNLNSGIGGGVTSVNGQTGVVALGLTEILTESGNATDLAILMSNTINDNTLAIESNAVVLEHLPTDRSLGITPNALSIQNIATGETIIIEPDKLSKAKGGFQSDLTFTDPTANRTIVFPDANMNFQTAATGTFVSADAKTVTVVNGIITSIV